jgi:hypothetical protein
MEALGLSAESSGVLGTAVSAAQLLGGANFLPEICTSHVWRGSSGIELQLQLRFDAWTNTFTDVLKPVESLIAMYSPVRGGSSSLLSSAVAGSIGSILGSGAGSAAGNTFLSPPGPTPASWLASNGNDPMAITVTLGNVMTIKNLIPTVIGWEFEERFDKNGNPMCALVDCSFISFTIPAQQEILAFFNNNLSATNTGTTTPAAGGANTNAPTNTTP